VIEIIQYVKGRCCCGKIDLAPENEDVIHNDTVHQLLGPEGNFCGPTHLHTIKNLESRVREIEEAVKDWHKVADQRSAEIIRLEAERDRLKEENGKLAELFDAAGIDNNILHERIKELRARHAALVKAVKVLTELWEDNDSEIPLVINEIMEDIIKALAEVKG
jgi:DNA-binding protein H-NS